ncbi:MAG: hypothetical protein ABW110_07675 [Steroidobacteraceae bacterium]
MSANPLEQTLASDGLAQAGLAERQLGDVQMLLTKPACRSEALPV